MIDTTIFQGGCDICGAFTCFTFKLLLIEHYIASYHVDANLNAHHSKVSACDTLLPTTVVMITNGVQTCLR